MASPVVKEFRCAAHGDFDGTEPKCPYGCEGTVQRVFLTPAAFRSNRTTRIDARLEGLAKSHGMTDISNRGGQAAKRMSSKMEQQQKMAAEAIKARYGDTGWGKMQAGGTMNVQTKAIEGGGPGAVGAVGAYGGHADNALSEVREALVPKPVLVKHDHEKHRITKTGDIVKDAA